MSLSEWVEGMVEAGMKNLMQAPPMNTLENFGSSGMIYGWNYGTHVAGLNSLRMTYTHIHTSYMTTKIASG